MRYMTSNEIRNTWLSFFKSKKHAVEEGASLIPLNDPTLLWINAGVAALKKYFDGTIIPENPRICNVQKAIRTNDIENVGHTARHHTFFEMMGNFSIGDYFRNEAIEFAFELLTGEQYFAIPTQLLYITYFPDDQETYQKWISLGMAADHMIPCEDNFWEIGEGPCGPDTEIFFDRGERYDPKRLGIQMIKDDIENDRYIEIWNIVFSQYNSKPGMKRSEYKELPHKNIDTGAGLERFCCILQDAPTNYETDLFMPIIRQCEKISKESYEGENRSSFKIIADHLRTCTFALADGAAFSNEGRGYVLRRLLRRAVRHGRKIGIEKAFLASLVDVIIDIMKDFYPYLIEKREYIKNLITAEEIKFLDKLTDGEKILNELYQKNHHLTGEDAFLLYDTYGYPFEITLEFAVEKGISIDKNEFDAAMERQKELARGARGNKNSMKTQNQEWMDFHESSSFVGYQQLKVEKATVIGKFSLDDGIGLVFDQTPFYAEMGGEIGDVGVVFNDTFEGNVFDTIKMPNGQALHKVQIVMGDIQIGDELTLEVNEELRKRIAVNHSATHLLDQALKDVLGEHVYQHGSNVNAISTRFDFNHFENVTAEQMLKIEQVVKSKIALKLPVRAYELPLEEAKKEGCIAIFGEKYGAVVRIINIGDYSKEFCGGCHVTNTEEIVDFALTSIESKGSGIYRIEGVSGEEIITKIESANQNIFSEYALMMQRFEELQRKAESYHLNVRNLPITIEKVASYAYVLKVKQAIEELKEQIKGLDKEIKNHESSLHVQSFDLNRIEKEKIGQTTAIFIKLDHIDPASAKNIADNLQTKYPDCFIFVMSVLSDKLVLIAKANAEQNSRGIACGKIVKEAALHCGGNGGGRPDFAQAGGKDITKADTVFDIVRGLLS